MILDLQESDRSSQRDSKTTIKQISEYLSLEEGQKIAQKKIKYLRAVKIEYVYYWVWEYETDDSYQMYAIVHREREKMYSQPKYSIGSCSDKNESSLDEALVKYHLRNGHSSVDN
jgi:hypothetical protein